MPLKKLAIKTTSTHKGKRLDQVLAEWLPQALARPVSKAKVRKLIVAGVRIASKIIQLNARIEAFIDLKKLDSDATSKDRPFEMADSHILYEDDWLIAVNKPPGLPTQSTLDEARVNLFAVTKRFLDQRAKKMPANGANEVRSTIYLGLHHRLDRDTSGVVLFTKSKDANAGVAELFSKHLAQKTYQALTHKPKVIPGSKPHALPGKEWTVKNYLGRAQGAKGAGKRSRFKSVHSGGDFAQTNFKCIEETAGGLWVEAKPKTGRTHQIRVHLAELGMPILGDDFYGNQDSVAVRLMLHASDLTFMHPLTKVELSIRSPIPEDFNQCLLQLRKPRSDGTDS
jgi:RluA family pseudouridine synthase